MVVKRDLEASGLAAVLLAGKLQVMVVVVLCLKCVLVVVVVLGVVQ